MTNCIFYSLFFVLFLNVSVGSLKYSQIHRTFLSLYKGMFEASTITVSSLGNSITPYFDSSKVETYIGKYFSKNISKYTKNYTVEYTYLMDNGTSVCRRICRKIRVDLEAEINPFYKYKNSQIFTIRDGDLT